MEGFNIYAVFEKMHRMRARLYPNYLPGGEGTYIARTVNEAYVTIEEIVAAMINRGGYEGDAREALNTIYHFLMEMLYQLADGFSVNAEFFSIHPNIGGVFKTINELPDPKEHPVDFRLQALKPLHQLAKSIQVMIEGLADTGGFIAEFIDAETGAVNAVVSGGDQFTINGHQIKIAGENLACGVYFENVQDEQRIKARSVFAINSPGKVVGVAPVLIAQRDYRVIIITQYSHGGNQFLKQPRVIKSGFTLRSST